MKMTTKTINLVPPNTEPDSFCRLCLSTDGVTPLAPTSTVFDQNAVQMIDKHLGIHLTSDDDFPCGLCRICEEKLEELNLCNADGLLDEWQDEDLLEYKASCIAVDEAIRNKRRKEVVKQGPATPVFGDKRVVLPFHKLDDGRYKCNVCPDEVFAIISACIKHYQEVHPVSTLSEISTEPAQNSAIRGERQSFSCVSCSARFENIDALIEHREANHQKVKKRKAVKLAEPVVDVDSVVDGPTYMAAEGEMQYYQCIVCFTVVESVRSLLEHRLLHVLDPSKETAERWLSNSANITPTNGFKCRYCIEQFVDSKAYYFHLNTVHDRNLCNLCGEAWPSSRRLLNHQQTHRTSNGGQFACDLCSITVFTQAELDDHRLHHQTLIPLEADDSVLPAAGDDCYFLDDDYNGQGNDECILSDDHQEVLQNSELVEDASTKVVEISDDED